MTQSDSRQMVTFLCESCGVPNSLPLTAEELEADNAKLMYCRGCGMRQLRRPSQRG